MFCLKIVFAEIFIKALENTCKNMSLIKYVILTSPPYRILYVSIQIIIFKLDTKKFFSI